MADVSVVPISSRPSIAPVLPTDEIVLSRDGIALMRATIATLFASPDLSGNPTAPTQSPGNGITTPVAIGQQTRWEAAGGALVMELYSAAGHEATYAPPPDYGHAQVTQERKLRRWLEFILQQD